MKRQIVTSFAVVLALVAFQSCQKESVVGKIDPEAQKAGIMRVRAGEPETKTYIFENGTDLNKTSYGLGWSAGDAIGCYEVSTVNGTPTIQTTRVTSSPLAADAPSATFTMNFDGNSGEANFSYIFVYPANNYSKKNDNGAYRGLIPQKQTFALNSFDKNADLLISEPIMNQASRPTDVNARFERIGATVLMNIKAPTKEDEKIRKITFSTTENTQLQGYYEIRPLDGEYDIEPYQNSGSKMIELTPANETTYTGTIPVWFRCSETTLSNNFTVVVTTNKKIYSKTVNLASLSRQLAFENAGLTKFNVDMTTVVGVDNPYLENGDYYIVALYNSNYYAMSSAPNGTRLNKVQLSDFDPNATSYLGNSNDIVWTVTNSDDAITIEHGSGTYLNASSKGASTSSTEQSFTIASGSTSGTLRLNSVSVSGYGLRYNSSSSYFAFYNSDPSASMIADVYFMPKDSDSRTKVTLSFANSTPEYDTDDYSFTGQDVIADPNVSAITSKITWSIDDDADNITSSFDTTTGALVLNGKTGSATVTASFAGDATYRSAVASYTITVTTAGATTYYYEEMTSDPSDWTAETYIIISGTSVLNTSKTSSWGGITAVTKESDGSVKMTADLEACEVTVTGSSTDGYTLSFENGATTYYLSPLTTNSFSLTTTTPSSTIDLAVDMISHHTTTARNLRLNGSSGFRWYANTTTGTAAVLYKKVAKNN